MAGVIKAICNRSLKARGAVESTLEEALRANLALAAIAARIKDEIDEQTCQWINQAVGTASFLPADNAVLKCHTLRLLGKEVIGALVIEVRQNARLLGVIAWFPEDPYAPVSWHTSWELLYMTLGIRLRNEAYRRYFQRFVAERDRIAFCAALNALLSHGNTVLPLELDGRCFAIEGDVFVALRQARIEKCWMTHGYWRFRQRMKMSPTVAHVCRAIWIWG